MTCGSAPSSAGALPDTIPGTTGLTEITTVISDTLQMFQVGTPRGSPLKALPGMGLQEYYRVERFELMVDLSTGSCQTDSDLNRCYWIK